MDKRINGMGAGQSDEWYTPPEIFKALDLVFDLDPCSPGKGYWVPAKYVFTETNDGLLLPWLEKFIEHGDGIAIVRAYTSCAWFHDWAIKAETICFPRGKTKFIRPDGTIGKSPSFGVAILGMGDVCNEAILKCGLGFSFKTNPQLNVPLVTKNETK